MAQNHGTCELCGGHNRDLRILVLTDWIGWACDVCMMRSRTDLDARAKEKTGDLFPRSDP